MTRMRKSEKDIALSIVFRNGLQMSQKDLISHQFLQEGGRESDTQLLEGFVFLSRYQSSFVAGKHVLCPDHRQLLPSPLHISSI